MVTYTLPWDGDPIEVVRYVDHSGSQPYTVWIQQLKDVRAAAMINARIQRLRMAHFGDHRFVGDEVWELKLNAGPGYRVYFLRDGRRVVILLGGGDKRSQHRDIAQAKVRAIDYWRRK